MQAELQKLPMLFATCKSSVVVMARMCNDGQSFGMWVTTVDGKSLKCEMNEQQVQAVRDSADKGLSWERFFEELQTSFNTGKVETNDGYKVVCHFAVEGQSATFNLEQSGDDSQQTIFEALLMYHYVHTHSRDVDKQLEEGDKREKELRVSSNDLEKEEASLNAIIERSKVQDDKNRARLTELETELADLNKNATTPDAPDETNDTCRARIPLMGKDCCEYDPELLRLIKSKFQTAEDISDAGSCSHSVIRPYTTSELQKHTQTFTSEQREKLWTILEKIDTWEYDCFGLQTLMSGDDHYSLVRQHNGGSLFMTCYALLIKHGCFERFNLDEQIVINWLSVVEAGYHGNPYHNSMHAADVLQITHYILSKGGLAAKCKLTHEEVFAALFSATIHDYDHPGINNSFHMRTNSYLATLYNDRSILENRHVGSVFELMKFPKWNVLANCTDEQRTLIRETIIEMVLATDMGLHGKYYSNWKRRLEENHNFKKKDDIRLALAMALKMADISNCSRPQPIYMRWGAKIADEFYMQGDREKAFGLPKSPFMDRDQPGMASGQISFMNYVVIPMFESISSFLPDMHFTVEMTESNRSYWQQNPDQ